MIGPDDSIGPYQVSARIGRGGMGEVFKAHNPRLGRDVALKVSHEAFTDRFTREARSIAALNPPNICHLYDVGPDYRALPSPQPFPWTSRSAHAPGRLRMSATADGSL